MDELTQAEAFSRELDKMLAGAAPDAVPDQEIAKDLHLAARLGRLDLSGESRIKDGLAERLLSGDAAAGFTRRLRMAVVPWTLGFALCGVVALVFVVSSLRRTPGGPARGGLVDKSEGSTGGFAAGGGGISVARASPGDKGVAAGQGVSQGGSLEALKKAADAGESMNRGSRGVLLSVTANLADNHGAMRTYDGSLSAPMVAGGAGLGGSGGAPAPTWPATGERYEGFAENEFLSAEEHPLSTFSIDVDAASYSNVRRLLRDNRLPPAGAVRVEELVNYFAYDYPEPPSQQPFSLSAESAVSPWDPARRLVRIGIKANTVAAKELPPCNFVFLIQNSGTMADADKLPLIRQSLRLLVERLRSQDRVSVVTFGGGDLRAMSGIRGNRRAEILSAIDGVQAGGSVVDGAGMKLAYVDAADNLMRRGANRVIMLTDGDFSDGTPDDARYAQLVADGRKKGIFLTVLGFGRGNYQDARLQKLADKGNGGYAYVDDVTEAERVLVREVGATLLTVAKDVKVQVEFNPSRVKSYRLIGYEKRVIQSKDFNDDGKDAGELGAGRTVTALYEIVPAGAEKTTPAVDPLKYRKPLFDGADPRNRELLTIKARYKTPNGDKSERIVRPLSDEPLPWAQASDDFRFAAAAAGFGMLLRGSPNAKGFDYSRVRDMAQKSLGKDAGGYRGEFLRLVDKAELLSPVKTESRQK